MANTQKLFFYAPTWDYPPDGPIKLGNVITSVKRPERPLHRVAPSVSDVFSNKKISVQHTKNQVRNERFSILVKFFSLLGLNVRVGTGWETRSFSLTTGLSDENKFSFKSVETSQFIPTSPYIESCIAQEDVHRFLKNSRYRKPVYVITGLKIVKGTKSNIVTSHAVQTKPAIQFETTLPHCDLITLNDSSSESTAATKAVTKWKGSDDFVFAFRVSKVVVGTTGQVIREEDYRRGTMLGDDEVLEEFRGPQLCILRIEDPVADEEGFDAEELFEGEEVVFCAIPRASTYDQ